MTDLQETSEEEVANPYNMRKDYGNEQDAPFQSADGVYYEKSTKATRKAPSDEEAATDYKKRYDDLKKHYDSKISEFKQKEQELQAEARMTQQVEQAVSHEERTEAQDEYVEPQTSELEPARVSALDEREATITRREAEQSLASAHPDFGDIRQSKEFHGWAESQPEAIQDWVYNNPDNVGLAIKAIDLYKMETGLDSRTSGNSGRSQSSTASAADMVSTRTQSVNANEPKVWSQREIAALSITEYDKYEQEIDSAIMEGRVVA
tara:strand:- start:405 stop:1196 length:792 start_codon:yes stop_codon:yes gene_type:complete